MDTMRVQDAEAFARKAHARQLDKVGMPYFETHVQDVYRRVVEAGGDQNQQVAALLHDVLEDTDTTEADLRAAGISEAALHVVVLMTKQDGQDKTVYLARIRDHEPARQVKLADIASNTDLVRLARLDPDRRRNLITKYAGYREALGADASGLQCALLAVPSSETEDERRARLDALSDERIGERLNQLADEDSFTTNIPQAHHRE